MQTDIVSSMMSPAECMAGEVVKKKFVIVEHNVSRQVHTFTLYDYDTCSKRDMVMSNMLFDNDMSIDDISDIKLSQKTNSCWCVEFGIHDENNINEILSWERVTFVDNRVWVSQSKRIGHTNWKYPFTEMTNGKFNARSGCCTNSDAADRHLITVGCNIEQNGIYDIEKVNRYGFMLIKLEDRYVVQHLNNFTCVRPEDVKGIWYNESLGVWMFENTNYINAMEEFFVYVLLYKGQRWTKYCAGDEPGHIITDDYTKAVAFFNEMDAMNYAMRINRSIGKTFIVDQLS